jgi:hypothetical protein
MGDPHGVSTLPQAREQVIQQLTEAFAHDLITVEELERRLEHVYRAQSVAEAQAIVVDIRSARTDGSLRAPNVDEPRQSRDEIVPASAKDRFVAILSSSSRRGLATIPHRLEALGVMSDSTIDLRAGVLPTDIVDIHVRVVMANMRIIVPAGLRVVNRVGAFLANVETSPSLDLAPMVPGTPIIRITGYAALANLEIVTDSSGSDEDDSD